MNGRVTTALIVILFLLGGYVYLSERSSPASDPQNLPIYETTYGEFDVVAFDVTSPQGQAAFARTDQGFTRDWQMVSPQTLSPEVIDQVRVNGTAYRLGTLTAGQVITDVIDLTTYGLQPPQLTVTLTISNGQKITLLTGDQTPVNFSRYIQLPDDLKTVYLVRDIAVSELHRLLAVPPLAPTPLPTITPRPTTE